MAGGLRAAHPPPHLAMATDTAARSPQDERLVSVGWLTRLLLRPDIGAFLGAVAVYLAFGYFARGVNWLSDPSIATKYPDWFQQVNSKQLKVGDTMLPLLERYESWIKNGYVDKNALGLACNFVRTARPCSSSTTSTAS